jgi:hypothetical protein
MECNKFPPLNSNPNHSFFFVFIYLTFYKKKGRKNNPLSLANHQWALRVHVHAICVNSSDGKCTRDLSRPSVGEFTFARVTSTKEFSGFALSGSVGVPTNASVALSFSGDNHNLVIFIDAKRIDLCFSDVSEWLVQDLVLPVTVGFCNGVHG